MNDLLKKKEGFSLVELMLVIAIIAIISVLAVGGYTNYRRSALVSLAADNLVAQLYELKEKTIHGNFGRERFEVISGAIEAGDVPDPVTGVVTSKCLGLYFEGEDVYKFEQEFDGKQKWNLILELFVFEACQSFDPNDSASFDSNKIIEMESKVFDLLSVDDFDDEVSRDGFYIRFVPPYGDIEYGIVNQGVLNWQEINQIKVVIKNGESDDERFMRNVFINLNSGDAEVGE